MGVNKVYTHVLYNLIIMSRSWVIYKITLYSSSRKYCHHTFFCRQTIMRMLLRFDFIACWRNYTWDLSTYCHPSKLVLLRSLRFIAPSGTRTAVRICATAIRHTTSVFVPSLVIKNINHKQLQKIS